MWGALSDERRVCRLQTLSRVRVARDSLIFYCPRFETLANLEGQVPLFYIPQEQGGPVTPPGTGFSFRRLQRLAELRWRYLNPPPQGLRLRFKSKSMLCNDRRSVGQSVLVSRGQVCRLQLLLALASAHLLSTHKRLSNTTNEMHSEKATLGTANITWHSVLGKWQWEINLLRKNYFIIKILLGICIALPRNCNSAFSTALDRCLTFPWGTAQCSCTILRIVRQSSMVASPARPGTKNECVGEDQQQFTLTEPNCTAPPKRRLPFAGLCGNVTFRVQWCVTVQKQ
jgi:hypothetical protein